MRVLFDQRTPAPLRQFLKLHDVSTAYDLGWSNLKNGELLDAAEAQGFQVLITTASNLNHQQNLANRTIAIVVLGSTSWPRIKNVAPMIAASINEVGVGAYVRIAIP